MKNYEIVSGCGAKTKVNVSSLKAAKIQATKLGFGVRSTVWIRENGRIVSKKPCQSGSPWQDTVRYFESCDATLYFK